MKMINKKYGIIRVGSVIECTRNDGRNFDGDVVALKAYNKGLMMTIRLASEIEPTYRNVYLDDCASWTTYEMAPI